MAYTTLYTSEEERKKKERAAGQAAVKTTGAASAAPAQQNTQPAQQKVVSTPQKAVESTNPYKGYAYNPQTNQAYLDALSALQTAQGNKPTYGGTYDDELHQLYDQIVGREKFRYNTAEDPLWQSYLEQYTTKGKLAMMDTMGQAAALTGGYGSSYGQQVGQQAYQGYLQEANQEIPQFYGMALDAYTREGDALREQYAMLGDLQDTEYNRYMDALNQHWNEVNYQQGLADTAYDRGYENWYNAYQMGVDADNREYQKEQDAYTRRKYDYDKLSELIAIGYSPTNDELTAAGMTRAQADALMKYYAGVKSGGSGGGSYAKESRDGEKNEGQPLKAASAEVPIQGITNREAKATGYTEVLKTCRALAAKGAKKSEISQAIRKAEAAGYVNAKQANALLNSYA